MIGKKAWQFWADDFRDYFLLFLAAPAWVLAWTYWAVRLQGFWSLVVCTVGIGPIFWRVFLRVPSVRAEVSPGTRSFAQFVHCLIVGVTLTGMFQPDQTSWDGTATNITDAYLHGAMIGVVLTFIGVVYFQSGHAEDQEERIEDYKTELAWEARQAIREARRKANKTQSAKRYDLSIGISPSIEAWPPSWRSIAGRSTLRSR